MDDQSNALVFMLLLKENASLPDAARVAARLKDISSSKYQLRWDAPKEYEDGVCLQPYYLDGREAKVALMPIPIPWERLAEPCAENRLWPEAAEVCAQHRTHLLVGLKGEPDPLRRHLMLTHFAAALAQETDALAVLYWDNGGVVQPAEWLCRWAPEAGPEDLPLMLWINFHMFMHEGTPFVATRGLRTFGLMEVEAGSSSLKPMELLEYVYGAAHYQCLQGPVLKDGDTVGASAEERHLVRHLPSVMDRDETVIRILFEEPKQSRGLFSRLFKR